MKKKILMISSTWNNSYIQTLLSGMMRKLKNADAELYVFNAYDEALESEYHLMERAIYSLPDVKKFDGVLLAVNSVGNQSVVNELAGFYHSMGKKVLSLELKFDNVPTIGTDNYKAEYELVEHLIKVHGCKVFNFVGGPEEHKENRERYQAFCDCLRDYGLTVDKRRVRNYSFREQDGMTAYETFKKEGLHLPDAVVCANDNMALGYCTAAGEDGYLAPKDYKITGFDNIRDGQEYYPSITSIDRCWDQIGYDSVTQILDMIDGKDEGRTYFKGQRLRINESCGCCQKERDFHKDLMAVHSQKLMDDTMRAFERRSRKLLCGSKNIEDFQRRLALCRETGGLGKMAICLNATLFTKSIDAKMDYDEEFIAYTENDTMTLKRSETLVPENWCEGHNVFLFSPLHFGTVNFGYCVLFYSDEWKNVVDHRTFMESICLGLEGIRQHADLQRANTRLEELYVRDAMTGMYNRFGYEKIAKAFYERENRRVYAIFLDLDKLKVYNDNYGHEVGDEAIHGIANGLTYAFPKETIQVRMGGDEFLVIGSYDNDDELLEGEKKLKEYLKAYSESRNLPLPLDVSLGHVANPDGELSLDQMIRLADQKMYKDKQSKKGGR
ncbi:MAG: GGDEF domain-containing protein [Clostridiales bacterium]|nr:GGDEF domain-containing protein [Candidatus Blautia equi]